ncbi:MAG: amylo-alpha-1,6-glucosidase [Candidatus Yanofskybacteria bacterium]|nr:amylo-alpha-1,6-glucosidase [Candidatus Yanofskybacteria bacterium]
MQKAEKIIQTERLSDLGLRTIRELETDNGILASSRQEIFGCIFGRDSLITSLHLLQAYRKTKNEYLIGVVKKIILNLAELQGQEENIESGEEPGKCIHEFRPDNHAHLTSRSEKPWYLYPDKIMRNYDSVDSTPLFLIALYRYYQISGDTETIQRLVPNARDAVTWLFKYGDSNLDGLIDYQFRPERTYGGLITQNWMDSGEALFHEDGSEVRYPVAPVEVQAYAYLALRLWAPYLEGIDPEQSYYMKQRAQQLWVLFNDKFKMPDGGLASGIDGDDRQLTAVRSSIGHTLWAALDPELDGSLDCIVEESFIPKIVDRLMKEDLFEPHAGIRTLSAGSAKFNPRSYHNGSIWPHDNAMIARGLENYGYTREAELIRLSMRWAIAQFKTPLELFVYSNGSYEEYRSATGQGPCPKQAWTAAALLAEL